MRVLISFAALAVFAFCLIEAHNRDIVLKAATVNTLKAAPYHKDEAHLARVRSFSEEQSHQYMVHVAKALTKEEKDSIENHVGIKFASYLPHNTYLLVGPASAASRADSHSLVQWVGEFAPEYKISPSFNDQSTGTMKVMLAPTSRTSAEAQSLAASWTAESGYSARAVSKNVIVVEVSPADSAKAARWISERPESHFIEPSQTYRSFNQYASQVVQTASSTTTIYSMSVEGENQIVGLADSGINQDSCFVTNGGTGAATDTLDLTANKIVRYRNLGGDTSDATGHGTAMAATIAGNAASSSPDGVAYNAKIHFTDIQSGSGALNPPSDLSTLFTIPSQDGVSIFVAPFGSDSADWYGTDAVGIDQFMYNNPNFLVITPSGNGQNLSSLALSKNALVVGSSMSSIAGVKNQQNTTFQAYVDDHTAFFGQDVLSKFSAKGPTPDGRIKPDVVAPGENIQTASNTACGTTSYAGTSFASAVAGGAAALVRQYFNDSWFPGGSANSADADFTVPPAALLKAMLINSGQKLLSGDLNGNGLYSILNDFPSSDQGFGRIRLDKVLRSNTYSSSNQGLFIYSTSMSTLDTTRYCFTTTTSNAEIKATLVWTDKEASPTSGHLLVNDIDLALVATTGLAYKSQTNDGQFDTFNNVEQVQLTGLGLNTPFAAYVHARSIPVGPQDFYLVVSGQIERLECVGDLDPGWDPRPFGDRTCPNFCSGYSACAETGYCTCPAAREGMDCSLSKCPTTNNKPCSGNGYCDYRTATCVCGENFEGDSCETEKSVDGSSDDLPSDENKTNISTGLLAGSIVAAFVVGCLCSVFLGGFLAVKYLERRRDRIQKEREEREQEMS